MSKTIQEVLQEFLEEQAQRLKPATLQGYQMTVDLFQHYLDGYAYQYLGKTDAKKFDRLFGERNQQFCEMFGPEKIGQTHVSEFLDWFVIRKVMAGESSMKAFGRVMKKLVKWLAAKGYWTAEEGEGALERASELATQIPECEAVSSLIYDYIQHHPVEDYAETWDSYFWVKKIEPGKLYLADMMGNKSVGPVPVSRAISDRCRVGWHISLLLGKTRQGWRMLESGNVYPE